MTKMSLILIKELGLKDFGTYKKKIGLYKCKCGLENTLVIASVKPGMSCKYCGSTKAHKAKGNDGRVHTRLYQSWRSMKRRCYDKGQEAYTNYGGRGITVCEEWLASFDVFRDWAVVNGYADNLTLEREHNDGNYEPSNCLFIPKGEQSKNRRPSSEWNYKNKGKK